MTPSAEPATNTRHLFLIWPKGTVEEVLDDDGNGWEWQAPGMYDDLVLAGYPLHRADIDRWWDGVIDLAVDPADPGSVEVYTSGKPPHEHRLTGEAAEVFLRWYRVNVEEEQADGH